MERPSPSPTRITFFIITNAFSGGEIVAVHLATELVRVGWEVTFVTNRGGPLAQRLREQHPGLKVIERRTGPKLGRKTIARSVLWLPFTLYAVRRTLGLSQRSGDIVVLQYKVEQLLAIGHRGLRRSVFYEHGPLPSPFSKGPARSLYRRAGKGVGVVIAVSRTAAASVREIAGREPIILPNGANTVATRSPADSPFQPTDDLRLAYVGRIDERKGIFVAVEAAVRAKDCCLVIAGTGPAEERLRNELEALDEEDQDRIRFVGWRSDGLQILADADWLLLPTSDRGEGSPLAALEALQNGTGVLGMQGSPAMAELQEQFGEGCVRVMPRHEWVTGAALAELPTTPGPPATPPPSWTEVATNFGTLLQRAFAGSPDRDGTQPT